MTDACDLTSLSLSTAPWQKPAMRIDRIALVALLCSSAVFAGCGSSDDFNGGQQPDTGTAGHDSGLDAVFDIKTDTTPTDAPTDATDAGTDAVADSGHDSGHDTAPDSKADSTSDASDSTTTDSVATDSTATDTTVDDGAAADTTDSTIADSATDTTDAPIVCVAPTDCTGTDDHCQSRTCDEGVCGMSFVSAGPAPTGQTSGDCHTLTCDGSGVTTDAVDDSDLPVDGNDCTDDVCASGVKSNPPFAAHHACSGGVCNGSGTCVGCVDSTDCTSSAASFCNPTSHTCVAPTCSDTFKDGSETDVDCGGGTCSTCGIGKTCGVPADCTSGNCAGTLCFVTHLVISEIQSSGTAGGNDEFVEIYNPTSTDVTLDSTWTLTARSTSAGSYSSRWAGSGQVLGGHKHILIAGSSYDGATAKDDSLSTGITDATSLLLSHGGTVVDAVCYYMTAGQLTTLTGGGYTCEGTPVLNPVSGTADKSVERKPGGSAGNGVDTDNNNSDFNATSASNPQKLTDPATP